MAAASNNYNNDVLVIATAFQKACEEDTRQVLNAMASKKVPSSLKELTFFLIPAAWMLKAHPMLGARQTMMASTSSNTNDSTSGEDDEGNKWREKIGIIQNSELLEWDHAVSSSDDEEGAGNGESNTNSVNKSALSNSKSSKKQHSSPDSCPIRRDLKHGVDFFLLGANAWMLLREKFGFDGIEIGRPCVFHSTEESTLAVSLDRHPNVGSNGSTAGQNHLVPVPPAGFFPYETLVADLEGDSQGFSASQQQPQQRQVEIKSTDVVSDEEGEPNDLFPDPCTNDPDDMVLSGEPPAAPPAGQDTVLLLPPSTSTISSPAKSKQKNGALYPALQDMDCVGEPTDGIQVGIGVGVDVDTNSNPADEGNSSAIATLVPSVSQVTRKRYGSGLGNLGNTCFMNSTLQCLAHTDPLRRYFLSGDFVQDLNKENPLGTGGELATEFARLLAEMWGTPAPRNIFPKLDTSTFVPSTTSAVYPRRFKFTLGKHAEQFVGYDQHDSQELATYLLDALHEDTNRVTKKPYVEKPEKDEDESDVVAAKKAWDLHLKREDSRVLENFMGQIKSRVQCCAEGCGRVSTTFDPFMYLSVPIPGSTERTLRVSFVPLDGQQRKQTMSVTLSKAATISKLLTKVAEQLMKVGFSSNGKPFSLDELVACDIWNHEVYKWFTDNDACDKIRDTDETIVYQVKARSEIRKLEEVEASAENDGEDDAILEALDKGYRPKRYKLDAATSLELNQNEEWKTALENYLKMPNTQVMKILNLKRGTNLERFDLYKKIDDFVDTCTRDSDKASNKRAREEEGEADASSSLLQEQTISADTECVLVSADEDEVPAVVERSEASTTLTKVKNRYDLAVLEQCAAKLCRMIVDDIKSSKRNDNKDGLLIAVVSRRSPPNFGSTSYSSAQEKNFGHPLILRIPSRMTVYGLREELAKRLARPFRQGQPVEPASNTVTGVEGLPSESDVIPMEGDSDREDEEQPSDIDETMNVSPSDIHSPANGDNALLVMRRIPLTTSKGSKVNFSRGGSVKKVVGSIEAESPDSSHEQPPTTLADPSDEDEQQLVSNLISTTERINLDWPSDLCDTYFDEKEFEASEEIKDPDEEEANAARTRKANRVTTLLDCVENYCQQEQLEETEMWYCNKCKEHVRAWKQFHIYQAPPILIMHLKRFQYSASTHRRDKISSYIDFPLTGLDLSDTVMHWEDGEKPVYDCYAVSNHYGGLGGGHYTAYALNDDGVWCYYDDSRITENVEAKDVVSEAAYVVYYRRRDVVVNNDFFDDLEAQVPAIVADHMDSKERTPSESSSTHAAQGDDMDVDIQQSDDYSNASSKTSPYSSPMDGDENSEVSTDYYPADGLGSTSANYPLQ